MIVSHDSGFLDNVCTDIIDYCNRKLTLYKVRAACPRRRLALLEPHLQCCICHGIAVLLASP